jgi:hypothetical protein
MDGYSSAIPQDEKQCGRRSDLDLLVVTGCFQLSAPHQQSFVNFLGLLDGSQKNRLGNGMKFRIGRIQQNHAPFGKQPCEEPGESASEILVGAVSMPQKTNCFGCAQ